MEEFPLRQNSTPEIRQYREQNVESLRAEVSAFFEMIHRNIRDNPDMLKDGEGVFKQERLSVWGKGHVEYRFEIVYREGSISRIGRPKKQ